MSGAPAVISNSTVSEATRRILFGPGSSAAVGDVVRELSDGGGVFLLAGHSSAGRPWLAPIRNRLPGHVFARLPAPYPTWPVVDRIAARIRESRAGVVVAVGGGSVMDAAKAAVARVPARPPVIAVPTTPGTGAEVTPFATVWDFTAGRKFSCHLPDLAPAAALVDPDVTATLAPADLGSAVMDTLAHGVEAAWAVGSTPESVAHALAAITLVAGNFGRLLADPADAAARTAISLAGLQSGLAIAISRTTICHALSYPITIRYGVPHGHACALTLAAVLRHNAGITDLDCRDPRGAAHVRGVLGRIAGALGCTGVDDAARRIEELRVAAGPPRTPMSGFDHAGLVTAALGYDRAGNNPRALDGDRLTALLRTLP